MTRNANNGHGFTILPRIHRKARPIHLGTREGFQLVVNKRGKKVANVHKICIGEFKYRHLFLEVHGIE